jgi:hypothetical protein
MSCSFDEHLARGSRGGVDYAVGVGTPVIAPTRGVVENASNSSAGLYVNFRHLDDNGNLTGFYDQFMHLSRHVAPGWYSPGDTIGISGNTGSSTGPHIHWDLVNPAGKVVRQWEYFTKAPDTQEDDDMKFVGDSQKGIDYLIGQEFLYASTDPTQSRDIAFQFGASKRHGTTADFKRMAQACGVPGEVVDALKPGQKWSRLDGIQPGGGATPAEIAKAVNDDAAKRMSS